MSMRFYYISNLQKISITIVTLMYCLFIGFLRPLMLNIELNTRNVIAYTLIFFAWYGCTKLMSNAFNYKTIYNKITNIQ
jgi:hypothetical protein